MKYRELDGASNRRAILRLLMRKVRCLQSGRFAALTLLTCFVSSCATPYQPLDSAHYGFSEQKAGQNLYDVSFRGNSHTSYEQAVDFAMLRASQIALAEQAKSFKVVDLTNLSRLSSYITPGRSYTLPSADSHGAIESSKIIQEPAERRSYCEPGVNLRIQLLADPPGSYYPFDPAAQLARLKQKYRLQRE